jgi:uncharacterized membrane protein YeiH
VAAYCVDVLLREVPLVLRREVYAVAASLGAVIVVAGDSLGLPTTPVLVLAALSVAVVRILALWRRWNIPLTRS